MLLELVNIVPENQLARFVDFFLLKPDKEVRKTAVKVLQRQPQQNVVARALVDRFDQIRSAYCDEFVQLLCEMPID